MKKKDETQVPGPGGREGRGGEGRGVERGFNKRNVLYSIFLLGKHAQPSRISELGLGTPVVLWTVLLGFGARAKGQCGGSNNSSTRFILLYTGKRSTSAVRLSKPRSQNPRPRLFGGGSTDETGAWPASRTFAWQGPRALSAATEITTAAAPSGIHHFSPNPPWLVMGITSTPRRLLKVDCPIYIDKTRCLLAAQISTRETLVNLVLHDRDVSSTSEHLDRSVGSFFSCQVS